MDNKGEGLLAAVGVLAIILVVIGLLVAGAYACGWLGLAGKEISPYQVYKDYRWFIDQRKDIDEMRADISFADKNLDNLAGMYTVNGTVIPRTEWAETDLRNYNMRLSERNGMVFQHNKLVKEYNANMEDILKFWKNTGNYPSKENWEDLPENYNEYIDR